MPRIAFEASPFGPAVVVDAPDGGRLVDICDEARAPVPFSCRGASCATCRIEVLEGEGELEPPDDEERFVLDVLGRPLGVRLACSAVVRPTAGLLRVRAVPVDPA